MNCYLIYLKWYQLTFFQLIIDHKQLSIIQCQQTFIALILVDLWYLIICSNFYLTSSPCLDLFHSLQLVNIMRM